MKRHRRTISALLLGASALAIVSCTDATPLGPTAPAAAPVRSLQSPASPIAQAGARDNGLLSPVTGLLQHVGLISCTAMAPASASQKIGPAGGTLKVGPHSFVVPSGALTQTVTITANAPSDKYNRITFGPEGLQFKKSASLTMSYANCNLLGWLLPKHIAYIDQHLNILNLLQSVDNLLTQKVTGKVDHFSEYAVAW